MPENSVETNRNRIYQLKIHLLHISPLIWRRILVKGDTTIAELHYILQLVMGWDDDHPSCFKINGKDYGVYHHGDMSFLDNPMEVCLADLKLRKNRKFIYEYDCAATVSGIVGNTRYVSRTYS